MYKTILVTLDGTPTDRAIIEHIKQLAKLAQEPRRVAACGGRLGGANFWTGRGQPRDHRRYRLFEQGSVGISIRRHSRRERNWLMATRRKEIVKWVEQKGCDLVAMSTHGSTEIFKEQHAPPAGRGKCS
jgi:nucleotide-binding universal stress UspA family protein